MIARVSLEKSLPRFASAAPFLCLIEDHLLCPDKACLPEKEFVKSGVVGELGMKRGDEEPPLPSEHGMTVDLGEHLDVRPDLLDPRGTDEHRAERRRVAREVDVGLERGDLAPECVAAHREVD